MSVRYAHERLQPPEYVKDDVLISCRDGESGKRERGLVFECPQTVDMG